MQEYKNSNKTGKKEENAGVGPAKRGRPANTNKMKGKTASKKKAIERNDIGIPISKYNGSIAAYNARRAR